MPNQALGRVLPRRNSGGRSTLVAAVPRLRTASAAAAGCALLAVLLPGAASAMPRSVKLSHGWEIRGEEAAPAPPQPPPPEESTPAETSPSSPAVHARASQTTPYGPTKVPGVFDSRALPFLYP